MNSFKNLFNVKVVENKTSKSPVALVYKERDFLGNKTFISRKESLIKYLNSKDIDISKLEIIPMEDGRIFGCNIEFKHIYYGKDISQDLYNELAKNFTNLQCYEI